MLATYSYTLSFTQYQFSKGSAVAVVLFLCLLIVGLFYLRLIVKGGGHMNKFQYLSIRGAGRKNFWCCVLSVVIAVIFLFPALLDAVDFV